MLDPDTFLTELYVMVDDFCKAELPAERRPGPAASLTRSEVITLALFAQWERFGSERAFYRYARHRLRPLFLGLPHRSQYNRLVRRHQPATVAFFLHLVDRLGTDGAAYEALDGTAIATRNSKRRGKGWLAGRADIGWSNRLGWYEGFSLLCSVSPEGILTGFGFGPASSKDQPLAETFLGLRAHPDPRLASVGETRPDCYVADKGFEGRERHRHWARDFGARVITPPKRNARKGWPKKLRRWFAGIRQIIETVNDKLHNTFRLDSERPHTLDGFQARLAATCALHDFCIRLNRQRGRPNLAFADLVDW